MVMGFQKAMDGIIERPLEHLLFGFPRNLSSGTFPPPSMGLAPGCYGEWNGMVRGLLFDSHVYYRDSLAGVGDGGDLWICTEEGMIPAWRKREKRRLASE